MFNPSISKLATLVLVLFVLAAPLEAQSNFSWTLSQSGLASAGVFDSEDRLVRTLWAMETFNSGTMGGSWDGCDDFGTPVSSGAYTVKILKNNSTYNNIGTIGNTGTPPHTFGHVPFFLEGVAMDAQSNVYTVHNWDEAHFDVIKWSPVDGQAVMNSDHPIGNALLGGITVEPDGSHAYVTGFFSGSDNDSLDDRSKSRFAIWRVNMAPGLNVWERTTDTDFSQQGRCIKVYDGSSPGYPDSGPPNYPGWATPADKEVMRVPLVSIVVNGGSLYVTDAIGGRILKYDKVSGNHLQTIGGIPVACGLAVASDGRIWVGHEHTKVSVYSPTGVRLATPITDLTEVRALSIQGNTLAVADRVGKIRKYTISKGTQVTQTASYGLPQRPGDRKPERLSSINGMAMDASGNVVVLDHMGDGSRMQKLNPQFVPIWQQMCLEFSSSIAYGSANPDLAFSSFRMAYQLDRATGGWTLLGTAKTDTPGQYFGNYDSSHAGPPRVVRLGSNDFLYYPVGDSINPSVAVYRVIPSENPSALGPTLRLAAALGGSSLAPNGLVQTTEKYLWEWNDTQGDGQIQYTPRSNGGQAGEVNQVGVGSFPDSGWRWERTSYEVDDSGRIWFVSHQRERVPDPAYPWEGESLYVLPPQGLNGLGNPIYRWGDAVRMADIDSGRNRLNLAAGEKFGWTMVGQSSDGMSNGMVYGLGWSNKPGLPQDEGAWMGGNVLFGFQQSNPSTLSPLGAPKWGVALPKKSVGMCPIPGGPGGVLVGIDPGRGTVGHYTKDGLLIGSMKTATAFNDPSRPPEWVVGGLDAFLAVNCNRAPDGQIDVFVEDNLNQRVVWYRVDDSKVQTVSTSSVSSPGGSGTGLRLTVNNGTGDGKYLQGATVNLAAVASPLPGQVFKNWTGAAVVDPASPNTTMVMPGNDTTVTANYDWATGNDNVRFLLPEPEMAQDALDDVLLVDERNDAHFP